MFYIGLCLGTSVGFVSCGGLFLARAAVVRWLTSDAVVATVGERL